MGRPIPILFGTETGNAQECAELLAKAINERGRQAQSVDMGSFQPGELADHPLLFIVTSTYGNGDPPSNAMKLLEFLQKEELDLAGVRFAVCGLGSSFYENFAQCGKDFQTEMLRHGANEVFDRVDCDEEYEEFFDEFKDAALAYVNENPPKGEPSASEARAEAPAAGQPGRIAHAKVLAKRLLSKPGSTKETMHYELDLSEMDVEFEVGDCFGVHAPNGEEEVAAVLEALKLDGTEPVDWRGQSCSLRAALEGACFAQLRSDLIKTIAALPSCASGPARRASEGDKEAVQDYVRGRRLIDVLTEQDASGVEPQVLVDNLRKLQPRLFSVASSPTKDPERVAFTIETVRYRHRGRELRGVASGWLADDMQVGDRVAMHFVPNASFHFPRDAAKVIMVGPGTGIAPFRGYLEEVESAKMDTATWLFFGHQHRATDFLYREEIASWLQRGVLDRADFAWSRDREEKVYVQHKILQRGRELWTWLTEGAHVFVCGDAESMAPAVAAAFAQVAHEHGDCDGEAYVRQLVETGRYRTDVY